VPISPLPPPKLFERDDRDITLVPGICPVIAVFTVGIARARFCIGKQGWEVGSAEGTYGGATGGGYGEVYFDDGESYFDAVEGVDVGIDVVEELNKADDAGYAYGGDAS
jgi:hypothetical protein